MPYCTKCGAKLKETDKFCGKCGLQVQPRSQTKQEEQIDAQPNNQFSPVPRTTKPETRSFGRDEMMVSVNTTELRRGGKIEGQATLNLVKPQKKGLYVRLEIVAEHREVEWDADNERDTSFQRIYEYRELLDGEREYPAGSHTYGFSVTVPENLEEWRMKRESVIMKRLGLRADQYLDKSSYDPGALTWYMLVMFNKRQLGLATNKQIPLTFKS